MSKPKWFREAEKRLDEGDRIEKTYEGHLDGRFGYLFITDKKLMFEQAKGFFHRTYKFTWETPYDKIGKIAHEGRHKLEITEDDGYKHIFVTDVVLVSRIEDELNKLMH